MVRGISPTVPTAACCSAASRWVINCADWGKTEALFKTAIDTFGDLNILVNNAGFCRDAMLFNMSEQDFDAVVRVHLKGHFCNMRHAAKY